MPEITLQPSTQDTYANEAAKTTIHGDLTTFTIRNTTAINNIPYVQFDLSTLVGKSILSAVFHCKAITENDVGSGYPDTVDIQRCTEAWDEATLDWSPQPAVDAALMGQEAWAVGLGWKTFTLDPTEFVLMIADNKGFRMRAMPVDQGGNNRWAAASSENEVPADRPKLVVNIASAEGQPLWWT